MLSPEVAAQLGLAESLERTTVRMRLTGWPVVAEAARAEVDRWFLAERKVATVGIVAAGLVSGSLAPLAAYAVFQAGRALFGPTLPDGPLIPVTLWLGVVLLLCDRPGPGGAAALVLSAAALGALPLLTLPALRSVAGSLSLSLFGAAVGFLVVRFERRGGEVSSQNPGP